jgi:Protein of unknown function (DUF3987)
MSTSPFTNPEIVRAIAQPAPAKEANLAKQVPRPVLRDEGFHGILGRIVRRIEPHTEADPVAILMQLIAACGNAIGGGAFVAVEATRHPCNEFVCIVGESSHARKGTGLDYAKRIAGAAEEAWAADCMASGLSSGEGLIHAVRDDRFDMAGEVIPGVADKRLLVLESEFGSTLAVIGRQGNTLTPILRAAWDGSKLRTLTKNNAESATGAHVSIIAHITREELKERLHGSDVWNGFANRFLWILSHRSKLLPRGGNLRIPDDLAPEITNLRAAIEAAGARREVTRSESAWQFWETVYPSFDDGRGGVIGTVTARGPSHVIRLALLFALLDESAAIEELHMRAAMALWDYSLTSAESIFGGLSKSAARILAALQAAAPNEMSRTDIQREVFHNHISAAALENALAELTRTGKAASRTETTEGAPRELWRVA